MDFKALTVGPKVVPYAPFFIRKNIKGQWNGKQKLSKSLKKIHTFGGIEDHPSFRKNEETLAKYSSLIFRTVTLFDLI